MFIQSGLICSLLCLALTTLVLLGAWSWSLRSWRRARRDGSSGHRCAMPVLVLSTLTLASLVGLGLQLYLSLPEPEEVFERTLGVPVSTDVTIVNLQQTGFGDHGSVSVCFQAAPETVSHIIAARKLEAASSPPTDLGCVTASAAFYARVTEPGKGSNHERVNGFSITTQTLGYDAATRTAYYVFQGVD